ncbi:App1 family protein [Reichenbachiella carrageenanivorans]|uniref:App1 family protein n=1 Tax=Reichenbachiella carrageenanivorans TaxID=2979869 RepID=A0ABY6D4H7_9BACT|nr:App1 family protein [Reichenbachiella carrageenanivorans]UXX81057.1 App1 family protein [Reichenbachiella carrageenanivorans]
MGLKKRDHTPVVWQVSSIHLNNRTFISGVLLNKAPFSFSKKTGKLQHAWKVVLSYFTKVYANKKIWITTNLSTQTTFTDSFGSFFIFTTHQAQGTIDIRTTAQGRPLTIMQNYPVEFLNTDSPFDIISDIDDTIIVSHTASFLQRIRTILFKLPFERKTVKYAAQLFEESEKLHARLYYVSKSESNLFELIASIIHANQLPKGVMILTPYLSIRQLMTSKKGFDFKANNIKFILENTGNKKYILLGDDTQKDMEVYAKIIKDHPERILKVYIRKTKSKSSIMQNTLWQKLKSTGVPTLYFDHDAEIDINSELIKLDV